MNRKFATLSGMSILVGLTSALAFAPVAQASLTYSAKSTAELYDIVDAQYTPSGSRIAVLANDTSNAVLQLVNPTTRAVTDTLAFTSSNTGGSGDTWATAADMAISADGTYAFIIFQDSHQALAKVNLSTMTVSHYLYLTGSNSAENLNTGPVPRTVSLNSSGATVKVFSHSGLGAYPASNLASRTSGSSAGLEEGNSIRNFAYDSVNSINIWSDQAGGGIDPAGRIYDWAQDNTLYAGAFGGGSPYSALDLDLTNYDVILGNDVSGTDQLTRGNYYLSSSFAAGYGVYNLPSDIQGVKQIVVDPGGTEAVFLSANGKIARMPLKRGWAAELLSEYSLSASGATLGSNGVIAVSPDGTNVTYLDSASGANDNIITITAAADPSTVPAATTGVGWYTPSKKKAVIHYTAPWDNGGSTITGYMAMCGKSAGATHKVAKRSSANVFEMTISRPKKKTLDCYIVSTNAVGTSVESNHVTITAKGIHMG